MTRRHLIKVVAVIVIVILIVVVVVVVAVVVAVVDEGKPNWRLTRQAFG